MLLCLFLSQSLMHIDNERKLCQYCYVGAKKPFEIALRHLKKCLQISWPGVAGTFYLPSLKVHVAYPNFAAS